MNVMLVFYIFICHLNDWTIFTVANMQVAVVPKQINDTESLTMAELQDVFQKAKNISHSKGFLIENEGEYEPRRSFARKMQTDVDQIALRRWINVLQNNSTQLERALYELEFLVHQIDTATNFMNLGGIEIIFKLMNHEDPIIVSAALSVLSAAIQGNPSIQNYMEKFQLVDYLRTAVRQKSAILSGSLSVMSSYLRNMPSQQLRFVYSNGLNVLADILKDYEILLNYKYKVIDLLGDLASDIYNNQEKSDKVENDLLRRLFAAIIIKNGICEEIPCYLEFEGFILQEKVIATMNALHDICSDFFQKSYVIESIKRLKKFYSQHTWYSPIDNELKCSIHEDLRKLLERLTVKKIKKIEL